MDSGAAEESRTWANETAVTLGAIDGSFGRSNCLEAFFICDSGEASFFAHLIFLFLTRLRLRGAAGFSRTKFSKPRVPSSSMLGFKPS